MQPFQEAIIRKTKELYHKPLKEATAKELYNAVSAAAMDRCYETWQKPVSGKVACYLSAEFLVGRLIHSNLLNLGLLEETESLLRDNGINPNVFEEVEDDALGNGGFGPSRRLLPGQRCHAECPAVWVWHPLPLRPF